MDSYLVLKKQRVSSLSSIFTCTNLDKEEGYEGDS